jgi:hypothetical protein
MHNLCLTIPHGAQFALDSPFSKVNHIQHDCIVTAVELERTLDTCSYVDRLRELSCYYRFVFARLVTSSLSTLCDSSEARRHCDNYNLPSLFISPGGIAISVV